MNSKSLFLGLIAVVVTLSIGSSFYIVSEKQRAILLRFGQIVSQDLQPGLHIKIPGIEHVQFFDARLQSLSLPSSRFLTKEKKSVIVDAFVKWRISNAERFYKSTSGDIFRTQTLLSQQVESRLRDKFGGLTLTDVVSGQRDHLMEEITKEVNASVEKNMGVNIIDVRVKKIDLPTTVSESVFQRMQSEREKEAREYRAQGKEAADAIRAQADKKRQIILANARKKADIIRGEGDEIAMNIYAKTYNKNLDFYSFYKTLSTYKQTFSSSKDLMILSSDNDFFKYFGNLKKNP